MAANCIYSIGTPESGGQVAFGADIHAKAVISTDRIVFRSDGRDDYEVTAFEVVTSLKQEKRGKLRFLLKLQVGRLIQISSPKKEGKEIDAFLRENGLYGVPGDWRDLLPQGWEDSVPAADRPVSAGTSSAKKNGSKKAVPIAIGAVAALIAAVLIIRGITGGSSSDRQELVISSERSDVLSTAEDGADPDPEIMESYSESTSVPEADVTSDEIREGIQETLSELDDADTAEKAEKVAAFLTEASDQGMTDSRGNTIVKESVESDVEHEQCTYVDSRGLLHIVDLSEKEILKNSGIASAGNIDELTVSNASDADAEVLMLYGLDDMDGVRYTMYAPRVEALSSMGVDIEIDTDATMEDYAEAMSGHKAVLIETHGIYTENAYLGYDTQPAVILRETVTDSKIDRYLDDLYANRAAIYTYYTDDGTGEEELFTLFPEFFRYHYGDNGLDQTYIHMGNCCGLGVTNSFDTDMADAFLDCGAEAVTGYVNSVLTSYDAEMMYTIIGGMMQELNVNDAVSRAKTALGEDDMSYYVQIPYYDETLVAEHRAEQKEAVLSIVGDSSWNVSLTGPEAAEESPSETTEETEADTQAEYDVPTISVVGGITAPVTDFYFPYSSTYILTDSDLERLYDADVNVRRTRSQLAINEIFARYGYTFTSDTTTAQDARDAFESKTWYQNAQNICPNTNWHELYENYVSDVEKQNIKILCRWQNENIPAS